MISNNFDIYLTLRKITLDMFFSATGICVGERTRKMFLIVFDLQMVPPQAHTNEYWAIFHTYTRRALTK